ncbi:Retrotransposon-like protein [Artemisia annua]|uniref:Retrotransposon-like protein n=1 Tax=Artemisia annua TaxID=35608 RepID=A0A2U1Q1F5_ARTAN|nr:Retrotransposon-like protein [Artemisia annua]
MSSSFGMPSCYDNNANLTINRGQQPIHTVHGKQPFQQYLMSSSMLTKDSTAHHCVPTASSLGMTSCHDNNAHINIHQEQQPIHTLHGKQPVEHRSMRRSNEQTCNKKRKSVSVCDDMPADLQNNKGVLNNGCRQKRRITTIERDAITERLHQQGVVNNKGKSIVYDDTSVETQYSNATHAIPNTSSPENQNRRMEHNCLPDACIISDSTPSCNEEGSGLRPEIVESLIRILDEHNELVQVFRTARDKVNDGTAEEFKIQLYNVVGTREYQLPSSGTLGAIVFQPDANSQTDYDVIIEYRDRGPQRINKLHSSYMSLQYPLLFVYGQPSFNTKMTLEGVNASTKRTKLSMNMFYKYQLHERFGQVVDPEDKSRREYPVLTDYIGCYISSGEKETVGDPMRDQMVNRKIDIQNLNGNSIELTLWDDLAETFKKEEIDRLEKPGVRFTCDGRITGINTSRDWYYPACTSCNLKLENNDGIYDCKVHGPIDNPTYRYNFKGYLTDDTATATITFFTPRANQIVGIDCNSLLSSLQDPDPRNVPQKIQPIIGERHIFQFYYNTTSKQGPAEFIFATLLDEPATMKKLTDIPSGDKLIL